MQVKIEKENNSLGSLNLMTFNARITKSPITSATKENGHLQYSWSVFEFITCWQWKCQNNVCFCLGWATSAGVWKGAITVWKIHFIRYLIKNVLVKCSRMTLCIFYWTPQIWSGTIQIFFWSRFQNGLLGLLRNYFYF